MNKLAEEWRDNPEKLGRVNAAKAFFLGSHATMHGLQEQAEAHKKALQDLLQGRLGLGLPTRTQTPIRNLLLGKTEINGLFQEQIEPGRIHMSMWERGLYPERKREDQKNKKIIPPGFKGLFPPVSPEIKEQKRSKPKEPQGDPMAWSHQFTPQQLERMKEHPEEFNLKGKSPKFYHGRKP